jgi:hypothetical protein
MADTIIPPWMRPVSPMGLQLIDDQTAIFQPRFGRNRMQRAKFSDPRWGATLRFEGMRDYERAALRRVLLEARGRSGSIWWGPGVPQRGSFPAPELLVNNDFSNGTTGWLDAGSSVLTASDRMLRVTSISATGNPQARQTLAPCVQYAPYACRAVARSPFNYGVAAFLQSSAILTTDAAAVVNGMSIASLVTMTATLDIIAVFRPSDLNFGGEFFDIAWTSAARCALVDGGGNLALYSEQLQNSYWNKTNAAVSADSIIAPDGSSTADLLIEDSSNSLHFARSATITTASQQDVHFSCAVRYVSQRTHVALSILDSALAGQAIAYFNILAGTVETVAITGAANFSNARTAIYPMGNGWYYCSLVARKIAGTDITGAVYLASADNTASYAGNGTWGAGIWRPTISSSSVPQRLSLSVASLSPAADQAGSVIPLKGLPASTDGLLLAGDFVQVGSQLVQLTAPLNSNAAGQGTMLVSPSVLSAADNTPVIINNPMGRFMLADDPQIIERYGLYTDAELELVEVFS